MTECSKEITIEITQRRYEDLIRTETKYNLLRNALEDTENYSNIDAIKKVLGIPLKNNA